MSIEQLFVLMDYQNQPVEPIPVMEKIKMYGRVVGGRAYGEWRKHPRKSGDLYRSGIDLIQMPENGGRDRKRVDIAIVVDAMEVLFTLRGISMFVLIAGDADYVPLVKALRRHGKKTLVIASKHNVSSLLVSLSDMFIPYEDIVKEEKLTEKEGVEDLAKEVYINLIDKNKSLTASAIQDTMAAMGIRPEPYGYTSLLELVDTVYRILTKTKEEQAISDYARYVQRVIATQGPMREDQLLQYLKEKVATKKLKHESFIKEALDKGYVYRLGEYITVSTIDRWTIRMKGKLPYPEYRRAILKEVYEYLTTSVYSLQQIATLLKDKYSAQIVNSVLMSVKFSGLLVGENGEQFVSFATPVKLRGSFSELIKASDKFYIKRLLGVDALSPSQVDVLAKFLLGEETQKEYIQMLLEELENEGEVIKTSSAYMLKAQ